MAFSKSCKIFDKPNVRYSTAATRMLRATLLVFTLFLCYSTSHAVLLFSESSVIQFTLGVSVPILTRKSGSVVFSSGFQMNYALPWNETQLEPIVISSRNIRDLNLKDTYTAIEDTFNKNGWRDGRECLLRTICELAEVPLERNSHDVFEEIIHLILTPSEDLPASPNSTHQTVDRFYHEAEEVGKSGGDCVTTYSNCDESPLEMITGLIY
ncbi:uncharacterized protein [Prorops nasuta]|uniref:uncharacterized protein n=1 Tax=Prorops nasuta TaxID=863751 RepID=UPI0034CF717A